MYVRWHAHPWNQERFKTFPSLLVGLIHDVWHIEVCDEFVMIEWSWLKSAASTNSMHYLKKIGFIHS